MFLSRPHPYLAVLAAAACVAVPKGLMAFLPALARFPAVSNTVSCVFVACLIIGPAALATWLACLYEEGLRQRLLMSLACGAAASFALTWADDVYDVRPDLLLRPAHLADIAGTFAIFTVIYTLTVLLVSLLVALWHRRRAAKRISPT